MYVTCAPSHGPRKNITMNMMENEGTEKLKDLVKTANNTGHE